MFGADCRPQSQFAHKTHNVDGNIWAIRPITNVLGKRFFLSIEIRSDRYLGHSHNL
jgi:hypothetical protein